MDMCLLGSSEAIDRLIKGIRSYSEYSLEVTSSDSMFHCLYACFCIVSQLWLILLQTQRSESVS